MFDKQVQQETLLYSELQQTLKEQSYLITKVDGFGIKMMKVQKHYQKSKYDMVW